MNSLITKRMSLLVFMLVFSIFSLGTVFADNSSSISSVQKGSESFSGTTLDVTINAVNRSRSIFVFSYSINNNGPSQFLMRGHLSSDTNIHFERVGGTGTVEVEWYVAEFERGVDVQYGTITQGATTSTNINAVNRSRSFPIISFENNGGTWGTDDFVRTQLTTDTTLETRSQAGLSDVLAWQVIEFTNATVQEGTVSLSGTSTSATINNVNLSKSFVITTGYVNTNTGADDGGVFTNFTNSTQLSFQRDASGGTLELGYHVVEFTGEERVFSGTENLGTGTTDVDVTLPESINLSRAIAFTSDNFKGGKGTETDDNVGTIWFTANLTNSTNLHLSRATTGGDTADVSWFVIEFAKVFLKPDTPSVSLVSSDGGDNTTSNLNCTTILTDPNPLPMNVTVRWYESGILQLIQSYNNSYVNGTSFLATLSSGNTSVNDFWKCSIRVDNGHKQTAFINSTELRIIDPNAPIINISFPINGGNYTTLISDLNHTITTSNTLDACWYTTNGGVTNTTFTCGTNISGLTPNQGTNTWRIYANDTLGNEGFEDTTFFVDTIGPSIIINSPSGTIGDFTPALNITLNEIVSELWYTNDGGVTNTTICKNCNETQVEFLVLEENSYTITVYANDSFGNIQSNITSTTVNMNFNLYDNFNDNSSVKESHNIVSNGNNITFTGGTKVLQVALICAAATCADVNRDTPVSTHVTNMGHNITGFAATDTTWNTADYDLAIISESSNSGDNAWLKTEAIPILTIEGANWDEFDLGTGGNSASGTDTSIDITNNTHYITQTFSTGVITAATTAANLGDMSGWSQDVVKLAHFNSNSALAFLLAIDNGGTLVDLTTAAEKRVFLAGQYLNNLNSNGVELFNRSIDWLGDNTNKNSNGNFTFHTLNVSQNIANITNVTWNEFGTGGGNNITVQISVDDGNNWYNATNGLGISNFTANNSLVVRVLFDAASATMLTIDNLNITWSTGGIPTITLLTPTNQSKVFGNGSVDFSYDVSDDDITLTCRLYINNVLTQTNNCVTTATNNITLTLGSGYYTWFVSVNDSSNNSVNSSVFNFYNILNYSIQFEKAITSVNTDQYFIETKIIDNSGFFFNYTYIDFIPTNFTLGSESPTFSFFNITNGPTYFGRTYGWNINTTINEVNYSLSGIGDYSLGDVFMLGGEIR